MWKKGTLMHSLLAFLLILTATTAFAQVMATQDATRWVDSYESYKTNIRQLDQDHRIVCEKQLYVLLKTIDDNRACSNDSECALVSEEPFGPVVPVRLDSSSALLAQMKAFRESCNDESVESHYNMELQHVPACWKNACMVKTLRK
jgi:hypothetical protein